MYLNFLKRAWCSKNTIGKTILNNNIDTNVKNNINNDKFKDEITFEDIKYSNNIIDSKFGRLFIVNKLYNENNNIIHYINNNISTRYIKRLFLHSPNNVILFSKYYNYKILCQIYNSIKKFTNERYYGKPGKIKNPFKKCKNNKEIYHLSRKIQYDQRLFLDNLNIIVDSNFEVLLDRFNFKLDNLKDNILEVENSYNKSNLPKFYKHDYMVPFGKILNLISNNNFERAGIKLEFFSLKKFIFLNQCWPPTQVHLYKLFYESIKENINFYLYKKNFLDIGCGSGVLSIMAAELLKGDKKFYGIDINKDAIKSSVINSNIFESQEKTIFKKIDFKNDKEMKEFDDINFDVIFSNPPFINSKSFNDSDLGSNDYKCEFVKKVFSYAESKLNKNGNLILFYSDLGEILELNEKDIINKLCIKHNFWIKNIKELSFSSLKEDKKISGNFDPWVKFKNKSKIYLYTLIKNN